jgi:hypothetical protein
VLKVSCMLIFVYLSHFILFTVVVVRLPVASTDETKVLRGQK